MSTLINKINEVNDKLEAVNKYINNLPSHKDTCTKIEKTTQGYYLIQSVLDKNIITITVTRAELVKACQYCETTKISETIDNYISEKLYNKFLENECV